MKNLDEMTRVELINGIIKRSGEKTSVLVTYTDEELREKLKKLMGYVLTTGKHDAVHSPAHYTAGRKYEPKDVIRDWDLNFNLGSAVKYIARAGRKDDIIQDLSKAIQYLEFEIEALKTEH